MDEEVRQWKQEYDRPVRIREFQPHWLTMFEWLEYDSISRNKWCWQNL